MNIGACGGTNFMNVFEKIEDILRRHKTIKELVVIFITDGQDGYYGNSERGRDYEYDLIATRLRNMPNLRCKFLSVGFSRDHDATFMNKIASFGNEMGNFVFIDSYMEGWREKLNDSMIEQLDIALQSNAKVKFSIVNR